LLQGTLTCFRVYYPVPVFLPIIFFTFFFPTDLTFFLFLPFNSFAFCFFLHQVGAESITMAAKYSFFICCVV